MASPFIGTYLQSADVTAAFIDSPEVAGRWNEPSALAEMSVSGTWDGPDAVTTGPAGHR